MLVVLVGAFGMIGITFVQSWSEDAQRLAEVDVDAAVESVRRLMWVLVFTMPLPILGFAAYLVWVASRVRDSARFPPPGMSVVRDTVVLAGDAALRRARILIIQAVLLSVVGLSTSVVMLRMIDILGALSHE